MSIHSIPPLEPPNPIQGGDLVMRKKVSGLGWHYGTGLSDGSVAHTTPETGKTITDVDGFGAGMPVFIQRFNRTPGQNATVELRALSNIGQGYIAGDANCEHDMTMAQTGVPYSPTANNFKLLTLTGGALLLFKLLTAD